MVKWTLNLPGGSSSLLPRFIFSIEVETGMEKAVGTLPSNTQQWNVLPTNGTWSRATCWAIFAAASFSASLIGYLTWERTSTLTKVHHFCYACLVSYCMTYLEWIFDLILTLIFIPVECFWFRLLVIMVMVSPICCSFIVSHELILKFLSFFFCFCCKIAVHYIASFVRGNIVIMQLFVHTVILSTGLSQKPVHFCTLILTFK